MLRLMMCPIPQLSQWVLKQTVLLGNGLGLLIVLPVERMGRFVKGA